MNRTTGVTITAIAAAAGAAIAFLFAAVFTAVLFLPQQQPPPGVTPALLRIGQFGSIAMFGLVGVWAAATAVGLWKLKSWGRWSVLIYAGLLIFCSVPAAILMMFVPLPPAPNVTEEFMRGVRVSMVGTYGAFALLGALLLYYFNRPSVRAQFGPIDENRSAAGGRPLSVTLIGAYLILAGLSTGVFGVLSFPGVLLGMVIEGAAACLFYLTLGIAYVWIGMGLLKLRPMSRVAAIAVFVFGVVNSAAVMLLPGLNERIAALQSPFMRELPDTPFTSIPFAIAAISVGALFMLAPIWFLVRNRPAFEPQSIAESAA